MSKTNMLMRAFNQAVTNSAVNFVDRDADTLVIVNTMVAYAEKNNMNVSIGDIEAFATAELNKRSAGAADFYYNRQQIIK